MIKNDVICYLEYCKKFHESKEKNDKEKEFIINNYNYIIDDIIDYDNDCFIERVITFIYLIKVEEQKTIDIAAEKYRNTSDRYYLYNYQLHYRLLLELKGIIEELKNGDYTFYVK